MWKGGIIYNALHNVEDDSLKVCIEIALEEEFKDEPEILDRIVKVFKRTINEYEGDEIIK